MSRSAPPATTANFLTGTSFMQVLRSPLQLALFTICVSAMSVQCFAAGDPTRGEALYKESCQACHSFNRNGIGPKHQGVFGRIAGAIVDYAYSPALKNAHLIWNEETLDKWLEDSQALVPGNKMFFPVDDARDRADLISFLRQKAQ
jgi:cytochrome c